MVLDRDFGRVTYKLDPNLAIVTVPDVEYTDPSDGKTKIVFELTFINQCPSRYSRDAATSLCAGVNKREQQLHQEYLTRLRFQEG